jgi:hypothetical protein
MLSFASGLCNPSQVVIWLLQARLKIAGSKHSFAQRLKATRLRRKMPWVRGRTGPERGLEEGWAGKVLEGGSALNNSSVA